ncbi:MAG: alanine racemase [Marinifilaceae bacterium]|jgi:alanine racemase|nr:alanine racemase [Marinifilaceae bacterium]
MSSTSEIHINKSALAKNIEFTRSLLGKKTIISAVIKGNAYGHGVHVMVPSLESLGVNHFSVYSSPEAKTAFYSQTSESTIMIMGHIFDDDYNWVISNSIEFYISNAADLLKSIKIAKEIENKAIIHLELETGMNRTGISYEELAEIIDIIKNNKDYIIIKGFASHFAGAESIANYKRIRRQFKTFKSRVKYLNSQDIYSEINHIASSAASISYPDTRLDLVRIGILIYGYWPTKETFIQYIHRRKKKKDPLERVLSWSSRLISIKEVHAGEFIGYGMSYLTDKKTKIGIIPVGYSNGYSRSLSNNGHVLIKGQKAAVIGSVNMNMIICDISGIENAEIGDQVILIGNQDNIEISFSSFAEMNKSMNYEILARLPENIKRKIIE